MVSRERLVRYPALLALFFVSSIAKVNFQSLYLPRSLAKAEGAAVTIFYYQGLHDALKSNFTSSMLLLAVAS